MTTIIQGVYTDYCTIPDMQAEDVWTYCNLPVKVVGFWGTAVEIRFRRAYDGAAGSMLWSVEVSHSSGGTEKGYDALDIEMNFGRAVIRAVEHAKYILDRHTPALEAAYQARMDQVRVATEAERIAREEALAADPALGMDKAKEIVAEVQQYFADNPTGYKFDWFVIYDRTAEGPAKYGTYALFTSGKLRFYFAHQAISRLNFIDKLAKSSHRTHIRAEEACHAD